MAPKGKDLWIQGLSADKRLELCRLIRLRHAANLISNATEDKLLVYAVPQRSLKDYCHDNRKIAFSGLPDSQYLVLEDELQVSGNQQTPQDCISKPDTFMMAQSTQLSEEKGFSGRSSQNRATFQVRQPDSHD